MTQLSKQLSENLVTAELARRGVIATPFSGNVPDFDILAFKNGKSTPIQVKSAKTGNITVANVTKDYLIIKQEEGNFQRVISKKEMPQWKKDLIFVVVFIGENLGEDRFYICKNSWHTGNYLWHAKRYSAIDGTKKGSDCKDQFDRANYWWIK